MGVLKNINQERAKEAYAFIQEAVDKIPFNEDKPNETGPESSFAKKYKSHLRKLPAMVLTNGLTASVAFAKSKSTGKDESWKIIYDQLQRHLLKPPPDSEDSTSSDLLTYLIQHSDSKSTRVLTIETLSLLGWMKRIIEGIVSENAEN